MKKEQEKITKFKSKTSKNKKIIPFVIVIFILFIGTVVLLFKLPVFDITEIVVEKNNYYTEEEIIEASQLETYQNIFGQVIFVGNKNILKLPYIENASVKIKFPNKIKIIVNERTSSYYAYDKESKIYYRINEDGVILEKADCRNENEIILIGFSFDTDIKFGEKVNDVNLSRLSIYNTIKKEYLQSNIKLPITKVSFENSLTTITLNDKLSVIFPNIKNLKYNIAFLEGIIKNIGEDSVGVIDLNKENPTFSNF